MAAILDFVEETEKRQQNTRQIPQGRINTVHIYKIFDQVFSSESRNKWRRWRGRWRTYSAKNI